MFKYLNKKDIELIKLIQEDIPLVRQPFKALGEKVGIGERQVLRKINIWKIQGILKRLGILLHHQKAGFLANGMSVWKVPEERIDKVAFTILTFPEVGHCYQRPPFPGWPYNLFAMLHGRIRDEIVDTAKKISERAGIIEYDILFTLHEYKKISMQYFVEEIPSDSER